MIYVHVLLLKSLVAETPSRKRLPVRFSFETTNAWNIKVLSPRENDTNRPIFVLNDRASTNNVCLRIIFDVIDFLPAHKNV